MTEKKTLKGLIESFPDLNDKTKYSIPYDWTRDDLLSKNQNYVHDVLLWFKGLIDFQKVLVAELELLPILGRPAIFGKDETEFDKGYTKGFCDARKACKDYVLVLLGAEDVKQTK